jgi:hypothetical protein
LLNDFAPVKKNHERLLIAFTGRNAMHAAYLGMDDSHYTDAEMESATGLPLIHVRRLITWGAVSLAKGGKGVVRQWDRFAIRHIACVNALYVAGLSLPMAHTLGMLTPVRLVDIFDPEAHIPAKTRNRWFDPQTALQALEKGDTVVLIADGYSIF